MKTVLVTGASGGIGGEIALAFAKRGYAVALAYNSNAKRAEELRDMIGKGVIIKADLTNEGEAESMFRQAERELGGIEVLINCAGIAHTGLLTDMTLSEWSKVINTNLTSVFLCSKYALPDMVRKKEGCIINIGSIWGETGASCEAAYSASKAGVIGLTKALAKEYGPSGIRVNCISPGMIETEMNAHLSAEDIRMFCEGVPLGRQGKASEVAAAAVFLAENEYLTGQNISVNGGMN